MRKIFTVTWAVLSAFLGITTLALTPTAFADGLAQDVDALETNVSVLDSDISALEGQVAALQTNNAQLQAVISALTAVVDGLVAQQADLVALQRCHTRPGDLQADADGNYVRGVDWHGCDKTGLALWGPFWGGDETQVLTNADLRGVDFTLANIWGVSMGGADLEGALFKNANLAGSNLCGANIVTYQQAQDYAHLGLQETVFINTLCPDDVNSDSVGGTCANNRAPHPSPCPPPTP